MSTLYKRRHHYIPQALSRNFALDGRTVFSYDVLEGKIFPTNPRDVFVIHDFHAVPRGEEGIDYNTVEELLSQIEGRDASALNKYIKGEVIDADERYWIAAFWALQYLRTPLVRRNASVFIKEAVSSVARILSKKGQFPPMPDGLLKYGEDLADLIRKGVVNIRILRHITMMTFTAIPKVSELLFNMNWVILKSEGTSYFVLSDNPCSIYDEQYRAGLGIGLAAQSVEIGLPVSRNHALVATWKEVPPSMKAGDRKVSDMNHRTALFGERFFVYPMVSKTLMRMLKNNYGEHPEADVQALPAGHEGEYIISRHLVFLSEKANRLYKRLRPLL